MAHGSPGVSTAKALAGALVIFFLVPYGSWFLKPAAAGSCHLFAALELAFLYIRGIGVAMLLSAYWASKIMRPVALGTTSPDTSLCSGVYVWRFWPGRHADAAENRLSVETIAIFVLFGVYAVLLSQRGRRDTNGD